MTNEERITEAIDKAKPLEKGSVYLIFFERNCLPQAVIQRVDEILREKGIKAIVVRVNDSPPTIYKLQKPEEPL